MPQGDEFFVENGLLVEHSALHHLPLLIDPHKLAVSWIRKLSTRNENNRRELVETNFGAADFLELLRTAIVTGQWILFNDVHEVIDPVIGTLLNMDQNNKSKVLLDGIILDVHPHFKCFLRTEVSNPEFDPPVYDFVTTINFTVTETALEDMLRGLILGETTKNNDTERDVADEEQEDEEAIDMECQYQMLRRRVLQQQNARSTAEDKLISILNDTQGNLLDQREVVQQLEDVKEEIRVLDNEISESAARHLEVVEERARDKNVALAKTATCLFFVLFNFRNIHSVYEFSLSAFLTTLKRVMATAMLMAGQYDWDLTSARMELVWKVFRFGSLTILDRHFFAFVLQLAIQLQLLQGTLSQDLVDFLINGSEEQSNYEKEKTKELLLDAVHGERVFGSVDGFRDFVALVELFPNKFKELAQDIIQNPDLWSNWSTSEKLQQLPLCRTRSRDKKMRGTNETDLTSFETLMLLRCFRPDHLHQGMETYIRAVLGERFLTRPVIDLHAILSEFTSNDTPIVFLQFANGFNALSLVERVVGDDRELVVTDLGCASERTLEATFQSAQKRGSWLFIANSHLSYSTLKQVNRWLQKQQENKTAERVVHSNFRLFLTTALSDDAEVGTMPVNLLSRSVKVNTEQPRHLRARLETIYRHQIDDSMLRLQCANSVASSVATKPIGSVRSGSGASGWTDVVHQGRFRSILYAMSFFHAVGLERRKYGEIGWNLDYRLNESELLMSIQLLSCVLANVQDQHHHNPQQQNRLPWTTIKYMLSEIIYGCHIPDKFDRRIVSTYMDEYLNDFLFDDCQDFSFYHQDEFDYHILDCETTNEFVGKLSPENALPKIHIGPL